MQDLKSSIIKIIGNASTIKEKVDIINELRLCIHEMSPFKNEPVDFVKWVANGEVVANDYNPNKVAPPEMQLLEVSITEDGYTQPIVTYANENSFEVVDGFHRNRVGKESKVVNERVFGFLPVVEIRHENKGKDARIASTIRHNRARGKHQVSAMSEIVLELKNRNWTNQRIARELGMDEDEILRLCQISGLESLFTDMDFSRAWISGDDGMVDDFEGIDDEVTEEEMLSTRIPNEGDVNRIFHTHDKWELVEYGFFNSNHEQPIVFCAAQITSPHNRSKVVPSQVCPTMAKGFWREGFGALRGREQDSHENLISSTVVRRITPIEAERLQGFPDNYTKIPGAKDGPRYKALGNSMAVPVMRWIGERILKTQQILNSQNL